MKIGGGFDGDGRVGFEFVGNFFEGGVEEGVEVFGCFEGVVFVSGEIGGLVFDFGCYFEEDFIFEFGGGVVVVEFVDVDVGVCVVGVDYGDVLDDGFVFGVGLGVFVGFVGGVWWDLFLVVDVVVVGGGEEVKE